MLISIIIPYYKGENFIRKLLVSIYNAIAVVPSNYSFEIIIIIDSVETEPDAIFTLANTYFTDTINASVNVVKNNVNSGVAASRNRAIKISQGDFLHIIDQDDEINPLFYKITISLLSKYNFLLTNGLVKYVDSYNDHLLYYIKPKLSLTSLLTSDFIRSPGQIIFSSQLARGVDFPIQSENKGTDDRFFWLKLFLKNGSLLNPHFIKQPLYIAHIHHNNFSADKLNMLKSSIDNCKVLQKQYVHLRKNQLFNNHIKSLQYAAKEPQKVIDKLIGLIFRALYFLEPNKLVRFYFKRII